MRFVSILSAHAKRASAAGVTDAVGKGGAWTSMSHWKLIERTRPSELRVSTGAFCSSYAARRGDPLWDGRRTGGLHNEWLSVNCNKVQHARGVQPKLESAVSWQGGPRHVATLVQTNRLQVFHIRPPVTHLFILSCRHVCSVVCAVL